MILYVESNFILELAYLQKEHENCERILNLAEAGTVRLVVPAFAMVEPYSTWVRRTQDRADLHGRLTAELKEMSRSKPYAESQKAFQEITKALLESGENAKSTLDGVMERVLAASSVIPLQGEIMRAAIEIQKAGRLKPQDSIVYASILSDLQSAQDVPKCFVSRDSDFADPDIRSELKRYQCDFAPSFGAAYGIILRTPG